MSSGLRFNLLHTPPVSALAGDGCFDLILAADAVWLDDLVEPLVRTLERLTACWSSGGDSNQRQPPPSTVAADKSEEEEEVKAVANGGEFFVSASTTAISAEEKISDVLRGVSRSCAGGGNFGNDGFVSPAEGGAASAGKGGGDSDMNRGRVPAGGAFVGGSGSDKRVSVEWTSRRDRHGNVERVQKNVEHGIGDKLDTNEAGLLEAGLEQSGPVTGLATSSEIGLDASPETGPGNAQDEGWRLWWWRRRRRVLLAYQWRSERTGRALLRELDKAFYVREIAPEVNFFRLSFIVCVEGQGACLFYVVGRSRIFAFSYHKAKTKSIGCGALLVHEVWAILGDARGGRY